MHPEKSIRSRLVTSVAWNRDLRIFCENCEKYRKNGLFFHQFERSMAPIKHVYDSLKSGKDQEKFKRFVYGFSVTQNYPIDYYRDSVVNYMRKCGVREAQQKLNMLIGHFSVSGQGQITRRQIEDLLDANLTPLRNGSQDSDFSQTQITHIMSNLSNAQMEYGADEHGYPDKDGLYMDMTRPVKKASDMLKYHVKEKSNSSTASLMDSDEACYIIDTDAEKAQESAELIANLEEELWRQKVTYKRRIVSMQKTAKEFGLDFDKGDLS